MRDIESDDELLAGLREKPVNLACQAILPSLCQRSVSKPFAPSLSRPHVAGALDMPADDGSSDVEEVTPVANFRAPVSWL